MDANWGWAAGVGFITVVWIAYVYLWPIWDEERKAEKRDFLMTRLWEGADGRASFSKFQFWLWTWVIVLGLSSIWIARMLVADDVLSPIDEIPESLLGILGLSAATSIGAKVITTSYVNLSLTRKMSKKKRKKESEDGEEGPAATTPFQELLSDDDGIPELAKFQMFLFTLVAVIFFLLTVADTINSGKEADMVLPDVDQSLLILMGISSGGYIGKKFVTRERPTITSVTPSEVVAGQKATIMLTGRALGNKEIGVLAVGPKLYKERSDKEKIDWTDSLISFDFDDELQKLEAGKYNIEVIVGDTKSEPTTLRIVKPGKEA